MPSFCCSDSASVTPSDVMMEPRWMYFGAGDGVVVGRHVLIVLGLNDLDIGEVADKDGEQRRKGEHRTG